MIRNKKTQKRNKEIKIPRKAQWIKNVFYAYIFLILKISVSVKNKMRKVHF